MHSDGYNAFYNGIAFADCPHNKGTRDERNWLGGWLVASLGVIDATLTTRAMAEGKVYDAESGRLVDA